MMAVCGGLVTITTPPREGKRVKPWQRIGDCAGLLRSPMGDPGLWLVNASVRAAQTDQDDR